MTQNLNSLNVSTHNKNNAKVSHFKQKISAILSKKCDIIFLQDVRVQLSKVITIEKIITCTMFRNYKLIANSSLSKRGVCISYKRSLELSPLALLEMNKKISLLRVQYFQVSIK
jgi:exonuclease III